VHGCAARVYVPRSAGASLSRAAAVVEAGTARGQRGYRQRG